MKNKKAILSLLCICFAFLMFCNTSYAADSFVNPLKFDNISDVLTGLLKTLQGIVVIIAIIMIVIGGMTYMFSGFSEKNAELSKKMIGGAVIGLAIVLAAPAFLKEILSILNPLNPDPSGLLSDALSIGEILRRILNTLLSIVGISSIVGLILGAQSYMTAYGSEERAKQGKQMISRSIIGILFAMVSLVAVRAIVELLQ